MAADFLFFHLGLSRASTVLGLVREGLEYGNSGNLQREFASIEASWLSACHALEFVPSIGFALFRGISITFWNVAL